jgi:hypothetical protein
MGERGAMGLQGPPGKDADSSELYRPLEFFACAVVLDLIGNGTIGADGITETGLEYTMLRYSNGDVEVSCTSGLGSASSGSGGGHFPAVTTGARVGGCWADANYPNYQSADDIVAGGWEYGLQPQPHATYEDASGHWLNGRAHAFAAGDCHAYIADQRGAWQDAALADVL